MKNGRNREGKKYVRIRVKNIKPGLKLDVMDTGHIWCPAVVLKIIAFTDNLQSLLIHYNVKFLYLYHRNGVLFMMNI